MMDKFYQDSEEASSFTSSANELTTTNFPTCNSPTADQNNYNITCDCAYGQQMLIKTHVNYGNTFFCSDQIDNTTWLPDPKAFGDIERGLKLADKIETIEITSKDLSPASCCSNVDLLLPDLYKNVNRDMNYFNKSITNDSPWYCNVNCNSKLTSFLSCCQVLDIDVEGKQTKCCNVQNYNNEQQSEQYIQSCSKDKLHSSEDVGQNAMSECNIYDTTKRDDTVLNLNDINNSMIYSNKPFEDINEDQNCSNGESDIIVEESDDELSVLQHSGNVSKCVVCNSICTPTGNEFFILTPDTPLLVHSQLSVFHKLSEFIDFTKHKQSYLCNQCLEMVNTIDNLQWKIDNVKTELINKYKSTCQFNSVVTSVNSEKSLSKKTFKNFCSRHILKCKKCKKTFSLKKFYWKHSCKLKIPRYLCEMCGRTVNSYKLFQRHSARHKIPLKKEQSLKLQFYKCKNCKRSFRTNTNLKEHVNYCLGKFPFVCEYENCDKKFTSSTKLKNHVKQKHDKKFVAICSICNIGFVIISDYKAHMVSHSTEKKYSCTKCDKTYKTLSNLNFHMKIHSETMPFTCTICEKGFMRKEYLESHVNNHYGIKNYLCTICNKKFVSQKNLDAHVKHHDGSVKTKTCNICGKSVSNGLEDHLRTHMNLQEFECELCSLKFNTKNTLSKHKKRKHCR